MYLILTEFKTQPYDKRAEMPLSLFTPKELKKSSSYMYFMKLNSLIFREQILSKTF
jgi:hypothetical protein